MQLTEKYRPQTYDEFIGETKDGNKVLLKSLEDFILNNIAVLITGKPGIGKTTAAYLVAKKLGYEVSETNASDNRKKEDLEKFKRTLKQNTLVPTVFLFDEIDGMEQKNQKVLAEIIKASLNPVVLIANDLVKVALEIRKNCKVIEVKIDEKTYIRQIIDRMKYIAKQEGLKQVKYNRATTDIRASVNSLQGSQGYTPEENSFVKTERIFKEQRVDGADIDSLVWILDNIPNFYRGLDIFMSIKILGIATETNNFELLSCLPKGDGKVKYPYYLRKRSKNGQHN